MSSEKNEIFKALGTDVCRECKEVVALEDRVQSAFYRWDWTCHACYMKDVHEAAAQAKKGELRNRQWLRARGINLPEDD